MKILYVNKFFFVRGGADRYFFDTMELMEGQGHEVVPFSTVHPRNRPSPWSEYFSPVGGSEEDLATMGLIEKARRFLNGLYSRAAAESLERLVLATQPDVAHVHNILFQLTPSIFPVLRRHRIPVVQSLHDWHIVCGGAYLYTHGATCERCKSGSIFPLLRYRCYRGGLGPSLLAAGNKLVDRGLGLWRENVDAYTVPGQHMIDRLADWGFPRERFHIVPNPLEQEDETPSYEVGQHVVWFGRMLRLKGIYTVLEVARHCPDVPFELYGAGPEEAGVRAYLREHDLTNVLLDTVTRWGPELKSRISSALCVIEPSEWYLPSQYVTWEAYSLGKAVLGADIGGTPEMLTDGETGLLFPPGDARAFAGGIRRLQEEEGLAERLGRAARAKFERTAEGQDLYQRMLAIYQAAQESAAHRIEV